MATVSLTFDVDAEAGLGAQLERSRHRLGTLTEHEFSVRRGLPRIVELLGEHGMRGTFYVPGATAQRHPEAIAALVEAGHEVAHHGHSRPRRPGGRDRRGPRRAAAVPGRGLRLSVAGLGAHARDRRPARRARLRL